MASLSEIIDYYVDLLIIQYHDKPRAAATIRALAELTLSNGLAFDIRDGFNVDDAVGAQLDIIGKYVGLDRFYKGQDFDGYFSLITYDEVDIPPLDRIGFADYTDFDTKTGETLTYADIISQDLVLDDDAYRFFIKLRIVQNNSNHSHKSIDDSLWEFFGEDVVADSQGNMHMIYFVSSALWQKAIIALQKGVLPRPMGVGLDYLIKQNNPFFGFATYSGYSPEIEGFTTYADYDNSVGEILNYSKLYI